VKVPVASAGLMAFVVPPPAVPAPTFAEMMPPSAPPALAPTVEGSNSDCSQQQQQQQLSHFRSLSSPSSGSQASSNEDTSALDTPVHGATSAAATSAASSISQHRSCHRDQRLNSCSSSSGTRTPTSDEDLHSVGTPCNFGASASISTNPCGSFDLDGDVVVAIKNTFINVTINGLPEQLDGFFSQRVVSSCPVTRCPTPRPPHSLVEVESATEEEEEEEEGASVIFREETSAWVDTSEDPSTWADASQDVCDWVDASEAAAASCPSPVSSSLDADDPQLVPEAQKSSASCSPTTPVKQVLRLGDVLLQPELGTPMLPTVGSVGHRSGGCKPCAFAHTKGCKNGVNCQFCHLCERGEKKRRQKQRLAVQVDAAAQAVARQVVETQQAASPLLCRPMMSNTVNQPLMLPPHPQGSWQQAAAATPTTGMVQNTWQGSPSSNLQVAAVFRIM